MIYNHLFWMAVALFFCSTINLNVYLEYRNTIRVLPHLIIGVGMFGMLAGLVRLISLSMTFNWWWFLGISSTSLLLIGIMAHFSRIKGRFTIAIINIALIPLIWWFGSKFNSAMSFDWFYDSLNTVQTFFS